MAPKTRSQIRLNPKLDNENLFNLYQNPLYLKEPFEQASIDDEDNPILHATSNKHN